MSDYYAILGVARNATQEEIKSAYRKLLLKHHPDKFTGLRQKYRDDPDLLEILERQIQEAEQKTKLLNAAYEVLSDSLAKARYDKTSGSTSAGSGTQQRTEPPPRNDPPPPPPKPKIVVKPHKINFGEMRDGERKSGKFSVKNEGGPAEFIFIGWKGDEFYSGARLNVTSPKTSKFEVNGEVIIEHIGNQLFEFDWVGFIDVSVNGIVTDTIEVHAILSTSQTQETKHRVVDDEGEVPENSREDSTYEPPIYENRAGENTKSTTADIYGWNTNRNSSPYIAGEGIINLVETAFWLVFGIMFMAAIRAATEQVSVREQNVLLIGSILLGAIISFRFNSVTTLKFSLGIVVCHLIMKPLGVLQTSEALSSFQTEVTIMLVAAALHGIGDYFKVFDENLEYALEFLKMVVMAVAFVVASMFAIRTFYKHFGEESGRWVMFFYPIAIMIATLALSTIRRWWKKS